MIDIRILGIVGAGVMGRGIAQIAALSGIDVLLYDIDSKFVNDAVASINNILTRLVEKGRINQEKADDTLGRIKPINSLILLNSCHVVVEAVVENIEVKKTIFKQIEEVVSEECILATNTSSLSVTAIAAGCKNPQRVAGFHFFNPVPLMKVVEVIEGIRTNEHICRDLKDLAERMGHTAVFAKDTPGFIVNHAGRAYGTEAMAILEENVTEFLNVDRILKDTCNFRMGPLELFDLTGCDVSHPATEAIYQQFYQDPKYRPSYLLGRRMDAGLLGRKSTEGFYKYQGNKKNNIPCTDESAPAVDVKVWVSKESKEGYDAVCEVLKSSGVTMDSEDFPNSDSLCIVTPLGDDATTTAIAEAIDPRRTIAVDTILGLNKHITLMKTAVTQKEYIAMAKAVFRVGGVPVTVIKDSAGFVTQRILAMIVNIGSSIAQKGIASPNDIDLAVTLGLGYPHGPLAWGDKIGAKRVLKILRTMQDYYGDPRYRPSPWLTRRANLGISLLTVE